MKLYSAIALVVQMCSVFISSVVLLSALPVNSQKDLPQNLSPLILWGEPPTEPGGRSGEAGGGSR